MDFLHSRCSLIQMGFDTAVAGRWPFCLPVLRVQARMFWDNRRVGCSAQYSKYDQQYLYLYLYFHFHFHLWYLLNSHGIEIFLTVDKIERLASCF